MLYSSDPLFWLLAIAGVVMTGISKSGFASGAGTIAVPLLAMVMPVTQAAALMLPLLLVMDARTISLYWHALQDKTTIIKITLAAMIGVAIAGTALAGFSGESLKLTLGILCLVFAGWQRLAPLLQHLPGSAWLWGTTAGITSTLLHAGGPPLAMYFLSQKTEKILWLAQAAVFFGLVNLTKVIPYSLNHAWNASLLWTALLLTPFALLGVMLGKRLQQKLSANGFSGIIRIMLAVSGLILIVK